MRKILGISGSLRLNSSNEKLLLNAAQLAGPSLDFQLYRGIDKLPFFHPDLSSENTPAEAQKFRERVADSHGLFISSPEYAHGVPGVLKNALDWLVACPDFEGKFIVLICSGEFAPHQLEETLKTMSAKILRKTVLSSPGLRHAFDNSGLLVDPKIREELTRCLQLFSEL